MPRAELLERLSELHAELERSDRVDDESRRLLAALADEIRALLESSPEGGEEHASLAERLGESVREFEESHPQLAAAVGRVADTLSNLGI